MRYGVRQMALGADRFLELTSDEHAVAKKARQRLLDALHIEQKFRLLLANYAELEEELLRLTNRELVYGKVTWSSMHDDLHEISRRLINLLTTSRLYVDQVKHDISGMYGKDSQQVEASNNVFNEQYDKLLGYRAMEALRNFVQHRSMPLHGIRYNRARTNSKSGDLCEHICTPTIGIETIDAEGGFKAQVLEELKALAEQKNELDLKPLVREYMTGLGSAHTKLRSLIDTDVKAAETSFNNVVKKFAEKFGQDLLGVALVQEEPDGTATSILYLVPDVIARRKELTSHVSNFRQQFSSSQSNGDVSAWDPPPPVEDADNNGEPAARRVS